MATTSSGLYPPIIDAYMPALKMSDVYKGDTDKDTGFYIYFRMSQLQSPSEISCVHVSINRQTNSHSMFATKSSKRDENSTVVETDSGEYRRFTRGIMAVPFNHETNYDAETGMYKIFIPAYYAPEPYVPNDYGYKYPDYSPCNFNPAEMTYNTYYKIQIRLATPVVVTQDNAGVKTNYTIDYPHAESLYPKGPNGTFFYKRPVAGQRLANYLTNSSNLEHFSEWSTVCLMRLISDRNIEINYDPSDDTSHLLSSLVTMSGRYTPKDSSDNEYLDHYTVSVVDDDTDEVLFKSQDIRPVSIDEINYQIPYFFVNNQKVRIETHFTTANLFEETESKAFTVSYAINSWNTQPAPRPDHPEDLPIIAESDGLDSVIGKFKIMFEVFNDQLQPYDPNYPKVPAGITFTIRRGEDTDDFSYWSVIYQKTTTYPERFVTFEDFTIESGVMYKYEVIMKRTDGTYRMEVGPIISIFDNAFLTGQGKQLCVKFNPNISGFKRNVSDNLITTIGGKYPYITRNGHMDYRSFSLSGTIAYEMDAEHQFTSRSQIYGDWIEVYGSYFANHYINQQNDRITQRKFREMVMDYLYNDIPKLFRSTPEGNILVRITDVNLTPNQSLGRMIYDFSCTATEIGEANVDNYKLYQIQDFGDK